MAPNVPAVVVAWEDEGLKVRLIKPLGNLACETEVSARPAVTRRGERDVAIQRKRHGLRLGGVVVLLKAVATDAGVEW